MTARPGRDPQEADPPDLSAYTGRWVAIWRGMVIAQGGTPEQAAQAAQTVRHKETPRIMYVPTPDSLAFPIVLDRICAVLPGDVSVYLVGGAVRDAVLGNISRDLDFALRTDAAKTARHIADRLGAAFYLLHEEFDAGRVILQGSQGDRTVLDFTAFRGKTLEEDLRARDFTINALAVDIRSPQQILDPLGGLVDLQSRILRACSRSAFEQDPVRILRAVRQAAGLGFHIEVETRGLIRQSINGLSQVSAERVRDELMRMLAGPQPAAVVRALDMLGVLPYVLPELMELKGVEQSAPHIHDAWNHTLSVVQRLDEILHALGAHFNPDADANQLIIGLAVLRLGRYRDRIDEHLQNSLTPDRQLRSLLFLAALYHDIAKPQSRQVEERGRTRFFHHEELGTEVVGARAHALALSNAEIHRLRTIVRHHMRPLLLAQNDQMPTRRAIYRFFRDTASAGVDVCLLSLADFLGTHASPAPQDAWAHHLDVIRSLLEAWFENLSTRVDPPMLIDGHDLIEIFDLLPGAQIGEILDLVHEAQAIGQIFSREDALDLVRSYLQEKDQE